MILKIFIVPSFLLLNLLSFGQEFENLFGGMPENHRHISRFLEKYDYNIQKLVDEIRDSTKLFPYLSDKKVVQYRKIDSLTDLFFYKTTNENEIRLELYYQDSLNFAIIKNKKKLTIIDRFYEYTDYIFVLKRSQQIKEIQYITKMNVDVKYTYNTRNKKSNVEIENKDLIYEVSEKKLLGIFEQYYFQ